MIKQAILGSKMGLVEQCHNHKTNRTTYRSLLHSQKQTIHSLVRSRHALQLCKPSSTQFSRATVVAAAGGEASSSSSGSSKQNYLYEPTYGLPVVRKQLSYSELLKAIRTEQVDEILFFTHRGTLFMDGPCIVSLRDGSTAQAIVPDNDFRVAYAMETHGVRGRRLSAIPTVAELNPPKAMARNVSDFLTNVLPYLAVGLVYVATSYVKWKKGDAEDREKIKSKQAEEAKRKSEEEKADRFLQDAEIFAAQGWTTDAILEKLAIAGVNLDREQVEEVVHKVRAESEGDQKQGIFNTAEDAAKQLADEEAFRAKMKEAQAENDPNAKAEEFRKMKTVKIQKAQDPARIRKLKEAQKQLKGVKLQYTDSKETVFFDDVAGIGDAKVELQEVVDFFRKPERFKASGARIPRGVLLCGPPGTGKTLLARAVAGEAGVAFLSLNASEFVEMFVGVGASRVRDLFGTARSMSPAIIFIDEIDSVGRIRGGAKGNDERDQTLNQMLSEMDGFNEGQQVIVMAATNRKDILDPALIRPGRFDRTVYVPLPDFNGRIEVLEVHLSRRAYDPNIDLHEVAFETRNYSGAQLANLVNLAATIAVQSGREKVVEADLMKALESERLGPPRAPYGDTARRRLAVMEGATSLLCTLLPAIEPVVQVTIQPREKFPLGQTVVKANEGRELTQVFTKRYLEEQLLTVLAGRAAEELLYGEDEMSTINQRRLQLARRIATKLVVSAAMAGGEEIGPRTLSSPRMGPTRGLVQIVNRFTPPETQTIAHEQMTLVINQAYSTAKEMLERNKIALEAVIDALMEKDTLSGDEVRALVDEKASKGDLERRNAERSLFL